MGCTEDDDTSVLDYSNTDPYCPEEAGLSNIPLMAVKGIWNIAGNTRSCGEWAMLF